MNKEYIERDYLVKEAEAILTLDVVEGIEWDDIEFLAD